MLQNGTHWGQIVPRRFSFVNTICRPYKYTTFMFTKLRRRGTIWPQCVPVYEQLFIANTYKVIQNRTHLGKIVLRRISLINTTSHWTYCLYFHSNYCTHSLYHFEKPAIVATKSYIFIFMHVKPIKVTSGFNLRVMKKIRQVALSYRKIKNKYEKADISTIDADPRVSKDAPGST